MFALIRKHRARRLQPAIEELGKFYAAIREPLEIRAWQLRQFNAIWPQLSRNVPFYHDLLREGLVPAQFKSWEEFRSTVPLLDRAGVQERGHALHDVSLAVDSTRSTGGSTSQPMRFPVSRSELASTEGNGWLARGWFGIAPSDRLFLFWGHSHQLGSGFRGRVNAWRREMKDALLGYCRVSAYDLSTEALRRAGDRLLKTRPAYVIGYSVALDRFARANMDRKAEFAALGLKVVIATAEAFPREDSATLTAQVLGCPVAMEYGSVETGPVAYQKPVVGGQWSVVSGQSAPRPPTHRPPFPDAPRFQIFWRHWFVEGEASAAVPGAFEIFLTSLYPRCFPLVRYRIGDLISENPNAPAFDQTFARVIGRCNDCITLSDGRTLHSEVFTHAIKECPSVLAFQVVQQGAGKIIFRCVSAGAGTVDEQEIRRRLTVIHPALCEVDLQRVAALPQTVAGKTRTIVREAMVPMDGNP